MATQAAAAAHVAPLTPMSAPGTPSGQVPSVELFQAAHDGFRAALNEQEAKKKREAQEAQQYAKQFPTDLKLTKASRDFNDAVLKYLRAQKRNETAINRRQFYEDAQNGSRYAAGSKPFKVSDAAREWDSTFPMAVDVNYNFTVPIVRGATLRQTLYTVHREFAILFASAEAEAAAKYLATAEEHASRDKLATAVMGECNKYYEEKKARNLGMEDPSIKPVPAELISKKVEELHEVAVDKAKGVREAEEKKGERSKRQRKKQVKHWPWRTPSTFSPTSSSKPWMKSTT